MKKAIYTLFAIVLGACSAESIPDYLRASSAGPDGTEVGLVFVSLASPDGVEVKELHLTGDRSRIRRMAVLHALDLLRRKRCAK